MDDATSPRTEAEAPEASSGSDPLRHPAGGRGPARRWSQPAEASAARPTSRAVQPDKAGDFAGNLLFAGEGAVAAQLSVQFGRRAVSAGSHYVEENLGRFVDVASLRHHFSVSNTYVLRKLRLLLWPWKHKTWSRLPKRTAHGGQPEGWRPPRDDLNAPDLYIPTMAFATYVLLVGVDLGCQSKFHPDHLWFTASTAIIVVIMEVMLLKLFCYLWNITAELPLADLLSFYGYKFVGAIVALVVRFVLPGWPAQVALLYSGLACGFFLLRSLRNAVMSVPLAARGPPPLAPPPVNATFSGQPRPISPLTFEGPERRKRVQILFLAAVLQIVALWYLAG